MSAIEPGPIVEQASGYPQRCCAWPHLQIDLCRRHWARHARLAMVPRVVRDGIDVASYGDISSDLCKQDKPSVPRERPRERFSVETANTARGCRISLM